MAASMNISGLASGLDTSAIISQMMAIERQPRTRMDTQKSLIQARQSLLQDFQSRLRSLEQAAMALRSPDLFAPKQTVTSSDPARIGVSTTTGAGVGGYQLEVTQLANSAQRTFTFTRPAAETTITIDGHDVTIAADAAIEDVVAAINTDPSAPVYAAATDAGTLVLSSRQTGDTGAGFIAVAGAGGVLAEQAAKARQGRDALYTVDGVAGRSSTNVVTDAVAGVTLTFGGVTTTTGPVTVNVGSPAPDAEAIKTKLKAFVDVYNATVDAIRSKLSERSVRDPTTAADRQKGLLFGDTQLSGLLSELRQSIYTPVAGLPAGMSSLADLGISTGTASGGLTSKDALGGKLVIDDAKLTDALARDPNGVRDLLVGPASAGGWTRRFEAIVHAASTTGGALDSRITGAGSELKDLQTRMDSMDRRLALREESLRAQFTALETALSQSQAQGQWLSGQLAALQAR